MQIATFFLLFCFVFFKTISGAPESCGPQLNNLTSPFTVTAYAPDNTKYNGLKIENWNVFQAVVASYCPFLGTSQANLCPNGTDMVLQGSLYPVRKPSPTNVNTSGAKSQKGLLSSWWPRHLCQCGWINGHHSATWALDSTRRIFWKRRLDLDCAPYPPT